VFLQREENKPPIDDDQAASEEQVNNHLYPERQSKQVYRVCGRVLGSNGGAWRPLSHRKQYIGASRPGRAPTMPLLLCDRNLDRWKNEFSLVCVTWLERRTKIVFYDGKRDSSME
jgi:hypothetical protein